MKFSGKMNHHNALLGSIIDHNELVEMIQSVCEKMDSIALNASIEAARSDFNSETFSNVAEQLHHQLEILTKLKEEYHQEGTATFSAALDCIGANLSDRAIHLSQQIQSRINLSLLFLRVIAESRIINNNIIECTKTSSQRSRDQLCEQTKVFLLDALGRNRTLSACVLSFQILNSKRETVASQIQDISLDQNSLFQFGEAIASSNKFRLVPINRYQKDRDIFGMAIPLYHEGLPMATIIYFLDFSYLFKEGATNINWLDGTRLLLQNGLGVGLGPKGHEFKDQFSWLVAYQEIKKGHAGYSIEAAKNGWTAMWSFSPMQLEEQDIQLATICWQFLPNAKNEPCFRTLPWKAARTTSSFRQKSEAFNKSLHSSQETVRELVNINEQTNMLAVNAAIQANMAGSDGKAFSTVASQIGRLTQTTESFRTVMLNKFKDTAQQFEKSISSYLEGCAEAIADELNDYFFIHFTKMDLLYSEVSSLLDKGSLDASSCLQTIGKLNILSGQSEIQISADGEMVINLGSQDIKDHQSSSNLMTGNLEDEINWNMTGLKADGQGNLYVEAYCPLSSSTLNGSSFLYFKIDLHNLPLIFKRQCERNQINIEAKEIHSDWLYEANARRQDTQNIYYSREVPIAVPFNSLTFRVNLSQEGHSMPADMENHFKQEIRNVA